MEHGIEGALAAAEHVSTSPFNLAGYRISVQRRVLKDGQHQRRHIPFQQLSVVRHHVYTSDSII